MSPSRPLGRGGLNFFIEMMKNEPLGEALAAHSPEKKRSSRFPAFWSPLLFREAQTLSARGFIRHRFL